MDIHIQKDTTVSLHKQLVTQISMQIASGLLKPGAKLPSIRALSQRLGIHHNTCLAAYRELDENGLIEIRHGSGARVSVLDPDIDGPARKVPELSDLDTLAGFFVRQVTSKGYRWEEVIAALDAVRNRMGEAIQRPLVFVDIHPDILPVFQAELQQALKRPVQMVLLSELDPESERESHFIVSRYHCQALRDKLRTASHGSGSRIEERITMIDVGSGQQELALIRQAPANALVAIFSASAIILQQGEAVVKALRGDEIYTRTVIPSQETESEIQRILKRAQLVFSDWLCAPELKSLTRKPVHLIRVLPDAELAKLQAFAARS
ncbi:MAG TPA: GntR family transcriptional regulator [Coleofasciculaceae cyanobacterium]|jgi:DNA-binding transcriptional regulator YhcF (GntR family)